LTGQKNPKKSKKEKLVDECKKETSEKRKQEKLVESKKETSEKRKQEKLVESKKETSEKRKQEKLVESKKETSEKRKQEKIDKSQKRCKTDKVCTTFVGTEDEATDASQRERRKGRSRARMVDWCGGTADDEHCSENRWHDGGELASLQENDAGEFSSLQENDAGEFSSLQENGSVQSWIHARLAVANPHQQTIAYFGEVPTKGAPTMNGWFIPGIFVFKT